MNRRQARKIGKRQKQRKNALKRQRGNPPLGPRQKAYNPAQLVQAALCLYAGWRRACPLRMKDGRMSRATGLGLRHDDWFAGNRIASLHDRGYYIRGKKPRRSLYDFNNPLGKLGKLTRPCEHTGDELRGIEISIPVSADQ